MTVLKLKQVAETLFLTSERGKDHTQVATIKPAPTNEEKPGPD